MASACEPLCSLRTSSVPISCIAFGPEASSRLRPLVTGARDGAVVLWNLRTRRPHVTLIEASATSAESDAAAVMQNPAVLALRFLAPTLLLCQTRDHRVRLFDIEAAVTGRDASKLRCVLMVKNQQFGFCPVVGSVNSGSGWLLLPDDGDHSFFRHDIDVPALTSSAAPPKAQAPPRVITVPSTQKLGLAMCVELLHGTDIVVAGFESGHFVVLAGIAGELQTARVVRVSSEPVVAVAAALTVSLLVVVNTADGVLQAYTGGVGGNGAADLATAWDDTVPTGSGGLCVRADGKLLFAGSWDGTVRYYDARVGHRVAICTGHEAGVTGVAADPCDAAVFATCGDDTLKLWRVAVALDA